MLKREIIATALFKLYPDGGWGVNDETTTFSKIHWQAGTAPLSEAQFLKHYEEAKVMYELELALQNRKLNYPPIGDQLDDLFKAGIFSESMAAKIQAIKDKYPKP
jgi:hypothetical protein